MVRIFTPSESIELMLDHAPSRRPVTAVAGAGAYGPASVRMGVRWTSEVVEMLVGCVGLGYVGVKWTETTRPLANGFRGELGSLVRLLHLRLGRRGGLLGRGEDAG